ncbi:hypothetical protein ACFV3N_05525 [Streptomyces bauhiniae]|uniref:hypothetical protein n=1 Tax=Streptomyces bauhiniae TaxID=2340725 RepID=UPI003665DC5D
MSSGRSPEQDALLAAFALASHLFPATNDDGTPVASFRHVALLAERKPWSLKQWEQLTTDEYRVFARVIKKLPSSYTSVEAVRIAFRAMLGDDGEHPVDLTDGLFALPSDGTAGHVLCHLPEPPLDYASSIIRGYYTMGKRRRALEFAGPGHYTTRVAYLGKDLGRAAVGLAFPSAPDFHEAPGHDALPHIVTVPETPELSFSKKEILEVAELLSRPERKAGTKYIRRTVKKFLKKLRCPSGKVKALELMNGSFQILNAPTGSGKTVLVRVLAALMAKQDLRLGIVVPDVKATLKMKRDIGSDLDWLYQLEELPEPKTCAALMSPAKRHERALEYGALMKDTPIEQWDGKNLEDLAEVGYACAQKAYMTVQDPFPAGEENCLTLSKPGESGSYACPFIPVCDKFRPLYEATRASVIITNHMNFVEGTLRTGVVFDDDSFQNKPRGTRGASAFEAMARMCHLLVVDEVDALQLSAIKGCAKEAVLASLMKKSLLDLVDDDRRNLPPHLRELLTNPLSHARLTAENLLLWLATKQLILNPPALSKAQDDKDDAYRDNRGWRTATSRDREIINYLFPDDHDVDEPIPDELFTLLNQLMPGKDSDDDQPVELLPMPEGADWERLTDQLYDLVSPRGRHNLLPIKQAMHESIEDTVTEDTVRARLVNLITVRAILLELGQALSLLREQAQKVQDHDSAAARDILAMTYRSTVSKLYPTGMLGRDIHGYQVTGIGDDSKPTAELRESATIGDPHTFISELGRLTSLMEAGVRRPVLGLSATAFFPHASGEHVHAPVAWWMPDVKESIRANRLPVTNSEVPGGEGIQIAGLYDEHKLSALREMGQAIYEQQLRERLDWLARNDRDRARCILQVNGYKQGLYLAIGIAQAEGMTHRVCVLLRREDLAEYRNILPKGVRAIVAEELEDFHEFGDILIAPMARIARGLNIVVETRSAISDVYLCVRPVLTIEDPAWMHGSVNACGQRAARTFSGDDPCEAIEHARTASREHLVKILRSPTRFSSMHQDLQMELISSMLVELIQLAGRARRGDTDMDLFVVDQAALGTKYTTGLAEVIRLIYDAWSPEEREMMNRLYGRAIIEFLRYAEVSHSFS